MLRKRSILMCLAVLLAALGLVVTGCGGGGGGVPKDAIAKVDKDEIPRSKLDALIARAQRSYKLQKRAFPKAGTPDYTLLQQQYVTALVNESELEQKAKDMSVKVTDKQVDQRITDYKKQSLGGSQKRYLETLKTYGLTQQDARDLFRQQLLSDAVYQKVTKNVKVADPEIKNYYNAHPETYAQPQSREVRHILVKTKPLADKIYSQLKAAGEKNFAALAKKYSIDPGSKAQGGKLTILKGQTVPQFDKMAFQLKTGELSKPVKTQYGWHLIQALGKVAPRKTTPLSQVKESIRQQLLQQKRSEVITKWIDGVKKDFAKKVSYQKGFAPPATTGASVPSVSVGTSAGAATTAQGTTTGK
jgi:parvulin-like peptidyl-prolyl isomerase